VWGAEFISKIGKNVCKLSVKVYPVFTDKPKDPAIRRLVFLSGHIE